MLIFTGAEPFELEPLIREFHYSKRMPGNIQHCYALRKPGGLFGCSGPILAGAIFSIPPTRWSEDVLELTRLVRHPDCQTPLTHLISESSKWLKKHGHTLIVSFADWTQKHHGGIYQAAGWNFDGKRDRRMDGIIIDGEFKPGRSCNSLWGTRSPQKLKDRFPNKKIIPHFDEGKYLYWKALNVAGRAKSRRLGLKSLPYPKPAARPEDAPLPSGVSQVKPLGAAP